MSDIDFKNISYDELLKILNSNIGSKVSVVSEEYVAVMSYILGNPITKSSVTKFVPRRNNSMHKVKSIIESNRR